MKARFSTSFFRTHRIYLLGTYTAALSFYSDYGVLRRCVMATLSPVESWLATKNVTPHEFLEVSSPAREPRCRISNSSSKGWGHSFRNGLLAAPLMFILNFSRPFASLPPPPPRCRPRRLSICLISTLFRNPRCSPGSLACSVAGSVGRSLPRSILGEALLRCAAVPAAQHRGAQRLLFLRGY